MFVLKVYFTVSEQPRNSKNKVYMMKRDIPVKEILATCSESHSKWYSFSFCRLRELFDCLPDLMLARTVKMLRELLPYLKGDAFTKLSRSLSYDERIQSLRKTYRDILSPHKRRRSSFSDAEHTDRMAIDQAEESALDGPLLDIDELRTKFEEYRAAKKPRIVISDTRTETHISGDIRLPNSWRISTNTEAGIGTAIVLLYCLYVH